MIRAEKTVRSRVLSLSLAAIACGAVACAGSKPLPDVAAREALAPSGKLRMGLYPGTPTSILDAGTGHPRGVGHDLGRALAERVGVPFEPVVLANNAEVLAAVKAGKVDLAFTNATPARAGDMDFTQPCLEIELGYLVRKGSPVTSVEEIDRPGVRVGVTAKSSSDGVLTRKLERSTVVRASTVQDGAALLAAGEIDAYATNKPTLFELGDHVPGSRVLDGRWGVEHMALALPKGRDAAALAYARRFAEAARAEGLVRAAIERAGLRGALPVTAEAPRGAGQPR